MPHLPEQPLLDFLALGGAGGRKEAPGLVRQVVQDRPGLEQAQGCFKAVVDNRRNPSICTDALEAFLLLRAFADVDRNQAVLRLQLFQQDADFQAIARRPVIQINHKKPWMNADLIVGAGLLANAVGQKRIHWLTHPIREQARSHI